jgi:hypothetical protein
MNTTKFRFFASYFLKHASTFFSKDGWVFYPYIRFSRNYTCNCLSLKGIGSIFFLKDGLKKNCQKKKKHFMYKNHLKRNNYEVWPAVASCFPNILDVMGLAKYRIVLRQNRATAIVVKWNILGFLPSVRLHRLLALCISTARSFYNAHELRSN